MRQGVLLLTLCGSATAWWDQGHMLVAAVAEHALMIANTASPWTWDEGRQTVERINKVLGAWSQDYPDFSTLISAAVWADHIKCRQRSSFCSAQRFDGIEIFNPQHFLNVLYNSSMPDSDIAQATRAAQHTPGNAFWLLSQISSSLSKVMRFSGEGHPLRTVNLSLADAVTLESSDSSSLTLNRHDQIDMSPSALADMTTSQGTRFSYNLLFRLFIHVFGDVHQPLHVLSRVSVCSPRGDRGGNAVHINFSESEPDGSAPTNLHELWDSCAGQFALSYPEFSIDDARLKANELISKYPINFESFDPSLDRIIRDSSQLARRFVYPSVQPCAHSPFRPSPEYISDLLEAVQRRIVEAGYALACYLYVFVKEMPTAVVSSSSKLDLSSQLWLWKCLFGVAGVAAVMGWWPATPRFPNVALRKTLLLTPSEV
eukprot:Protomagalhaensia_sp_Gyna_25__5537@NODE_74_length_5586_cov_71_771588_g56_i0_p2_GENE_NODE_74_length_5586_cov_71_771588_g56_i0NODE_74_length_5586_cov_71_771588_g56_i0_p2_ORF_typecomplete_len429_score27_12S1P1_nuclease/PF02265_16/2e32DUF4402/PF14352_6/0_1P3A/PF08727_11/0_14_NODE_74_length_5586_cov_71_771588_g56_i013142600